MSKETFYFSHDYNARADDKIKRLIRVHGVTGYGIFWAIVEDLYNNKNSIHLDYDAIAYDLRVDSKMVKSIINDFDLFVFENGSFGSISVEKRIEERNLKSKKASESAYFRWSKSSANINKEERSSLPQVYIIKVFDESECFIKIGITTSTISERYSGSLPYKYEVLMQIFSPEYIKIEIEINDLLKNFIYSPIKDFPGKLECYSIDTLTVIKEFKSSFKVTQLCDRIKITSERIQVDCEGNAIKDSIVKDSIVNNTWRNDFLIYMTECKLEYKNFMEDSELLKIQQRLNPGINIKISIEKGFINFWGTELGWKHKKSKRSKEIDWKSTIINSISMNKVYYTKQEIALQC